MTTGRINQVSTLREQAQARGGRENSATAALDPRHAEARRGAKKPALAARAIARVF